MAEEARGEYRNRDEWGIFPRDRHGVRGERHLGHIEFAVAQHAKERLLDMLVQIDELDAFGLHAAVGERTRAVVIPAGEGQPQLAQINSPKRRRIIPGSRQSGRGGAVSLRADRRWSLAASRSAPSRPALHRAQDSPEPRAGCVAWLSCRP